MISGLSPILLPDAVCKDCGNKCRTEVQRNKVGGVVAVRLYCDTCKLGWEMFPQHINATNLRYIEPVKVEEVKPAIKVEEPKPDVSA